MSLAVLPAELKHRIYKLLPEAERCKLSAINREWRGIALYVRQFELIVEIPFFRDPTDPVSPFRYPKGPHAPAAASRKITRVDITIKDPPQYCSTYNRSNVAIGRWIRAAAQFTSKLARMNQFLLTTKNRYIYIDYISAGKLVRALTVRSSPVVDLHIDIVATRLAPAHRDFYGIDRYHICNMIPLMLPHLQHLYIRLDVMCANLLTLTPPLDKDATLPLRSMIINFAIISKYFKHDDDYLPLPHHCQYSLNLYRDERPDEDNNFGYLTSFARQMWKICDASPQLDMARIVRIVHEEHENCLVFGGCMRLLAEDVPSGEQWWVTEGAEHGGTQVPEDEQQISCLQALYEDSEFDERLLDWHSNSWQDGSMADTEEELEREAREGLWDYEGEDEDEEMDEEGYEGDGEGINFEVGLVAGRGSWVVGQELVG